VRHTKKVIVPALDLENPTYADTPKNPAAAEKHIYEGASTPGLLGVEEYECWIVAVRLAETTPVSVPAPLLPVPTVTHTPILVFAAPVPYSIFKNTEESGNRHISYPAAVLIAVG
jgi:hypothetical protein